MNFDPTFKEFINKFDPKNIFDSDEPCLYGKLLHCNNVEMIGKELLKNAKNGILMDKELLCICLRLHDIGVKKQYEELHNFDDTGLDHHILGARLIESYMPEKHESYWEILRDCCLYHGHISNPDIPVESLRYVNIVTLADQIETGCISAVTFFEREKGTDNQCFKKRFPELEQNICTDKVLRYIKSGELFDKIEYCETYADYLAYLILLMVTTCRNYSLSKKYASIDIYNNIGKQTTPANEMKRICKDHIKGKAAELLCNLIDEYTKTGV